MSASTLKELSLFAYASDDVVNVLKDLSETKASFDAAIDAVKCGIDELNALTTKYVGTTNAVTTKTCTDVLITCAASTNRLRNLRLCMRRMSKLTRIYESITTHAVF